MKITYSILNVFGVGGTVRTVVNQANALAEAGHEVEILTTIQYGTTPPFPLDRRVRLRAMMDMRGRSIDGIAPGTEIPVGENSRHHFVPECEQAVIKAYRELDSDVLITTRVALNLMAARYAPEGLVRIAQDHMNFASYRPAVQEAILADYPRLDAVVCLTERDRETYRAQLGDSVRLETIPNALHTLDVPQADPDSRIIVTAGRLVPQKGYDLLIRAFAEVAPHHPDWQLRIYGHGKEEATRKLRKLINRHHLYNNVLLMGQSRTLGQELAKASFYVMSSRHEGFPMILMEALSHALPVVSFDCPTGPREILTEHEDGLLVPPKDTSALAQSMIRLIESPDLRRTMGRTARVNAHSHAPGSVRPRWESLFTELAARKAPLAAGLGRL